MSEISTLVVDDEPAIRELLAMQLSSLGCKVETAPDGAAALEKFQAGDFELVFTDVRMPRMSGLQLLHQVRCLSPRTSVVVLSGFATIEETVQALRLGALDFIYKPFKQAEVERTLHRFRRVRQAAQVTDEVLGSLQQSSQRMELPSDRDVARPIALSLTRDLVALGLATPEECDSASLAVHEAILNAIIHGNLGVASTVKNEDPEQFESLIHERMKDPARGKRLVRIEANADRSKAEFVIEDEGEGFDYRQLPDPSQVSTMMDATGRGLLIMRLTMDEVTWNDKGNSVRLVWRPRSKTD